MEYNNQVMHKKIVIGLGNPDPLLENTYHNAGTLALLFLAKKLTGEVAEMNFKEYKGIFEYIKIGGRVLVRPLTFMNDSGRAVAAALKMFGATAEDIAVMHDDSDIMIGNVRFAMNGGSAGHNGIQSIIDHIKTYDFLRVRIGIREKDEVRRKKAMEFVLSPIKKADAKLLAQSFEEIEKKLFAEG
jgi:PTH1 family peptidyl-tRNA hydrolase